MRELRVWFDAKSIEDIRQTRYASLATDITQNLMIYFKMNQVNERSYIKNEILISDNDFVTNMIISPYYP